MSEKLSTSILDFALAIHALAPDLKGRVAVSYVMDDGQGRKAYCVEDLSTGRRKSLLILSTYTSVKALAVELIDWVREVPAPDDIADWPIPEGSLIAMPAGYRELFRKVIMLGKPGFDAVQAIVIKAAHA